MARLIPSSRGMKFVLGVLGPLAAVVVFVWVIPGVVRVIRESNHADSHGEPSSSVAFSSVLDDSPRRNSLPVLRRLRTFGSRGDLPEGSISHIADVRGDRIVMVGSTWITSIDKGDGEVGPVASLGARSGPDNLLRRIGRITGAIVAPASDIWLGGRRGLAKLDFDAPGRLTPVIRFDDGARPPMAWFGDTIVTSSNTEFLRFYDADLDGTVSGDGPHETRATLRRSVGEPLFPITTTGLPVFFNWVSFAVRPDQRRLAAAFRLSDRIHVYDEDGELVRAVAGPVAVKLDFDIVPRLPGVGGYTFGVNEETRFAYLSADGDDDFIMALFSGLYPGSDDDISTGDELHVFRWDGTLAGVWRLPASIEAFRLDPASRRIYGSPGVREASPFPSVVEFDAEPIYEQGRRGAGPGG